MKTRLANEKDPRVGYHDFKPSYAPPPTKPIKDMTDTECAYAEGLLAGMEHMARQMDKKCKKCRRKK